MAAFDTHKSKVIDPLALEDGDRGAPPQPTE